MRARGAHAVRLAVALLLVAVGAGSAQAATPHAALRLTSVSPKGSAPGDATIALRFSTPLAPVTARTEPRLSPRIAGAWSQPNPTTLAFTPTGAYLPGTVVHVAVPRALTAADGAELRRASTVEFVVQNGSDVRLTQLLAELRYLPVHLTSIRHQPAPGNAAGQLRAIFQPPAGRLALGAEWPSQLSSLWIHDPSIVLRGAVMAFESQHGLAIDGVVSAAVWQALLSARVHRQFNQDGYSYAVATKSSPESLTVYHNGHVVVHTPANTGIGGRGRHPAPSRCSSGCEARRCRARTRTGRTTRTSCSGSRTSTVATPSTTCPARPTGRRRASGASRFPTPPPSRRGAT